MNEIEEGGGEGWGGRIGRGNEKKERGVREFVEETEGGGVNFKEVIKEPTFFTWSMKTVTAPCCQGPSTTCLPSKRLKLVMSNVSSSKYWVWNLTEFLC